MTTRRGFIRTGAVALTGLATGGTALAARMMRSGGMAPDSLRPAAADRLFTSNAVEEVIVRYKARIKDARLAWMFENCYPNTLDTTCFFSWKGSGPDTFVITGDIDAMWLRDSSAQVYPYVSLAGHDEQLRTMIAGLIRRQTDCILIDPYANAFNREATGSEWEADHTVMRKELHERKWEVDSLCYPLRLAHQYRKMTGDTSVFDARWMEALAAIVRTFKEQQRSVGNEGTYRFTRTTDRAGDTLSNDGWGSPVKHTGLIVSSFRPSDDATVYGYLIPSNLFAVTSLRQAASIVRAVGGSGELAASCDALAAVVEAAVVKHGIVGHPEYGRVYAYEVDGFGNYICMDDANIPSLLSLPYLGCVDMADPVYRATRRLILSHSNPYFFAGKAAEGIGGPHIGFDYIWPMSLIMRAATSTDEAEIVRCVHTLRDTDGGTGFMHEAFHKDDPNLFTRKWFAWANTLFGELIVNLVNKGLSL
ncbi:MAG: glycoside hydrolase family 125 protein [Tannerellaceae bacterium]|nr:glycoside hydrolase family 125 protein [Tannerellaceae bacterium]